MLDDEFRARSITELDGSKKRPLPVKGVSIGGRDKHYIVHLCSEYTRLIDRGINTG